MFTPGHTNKNEPTYRPRPDRLKEYAVFHGNAQTTYVSDNVLQTIACDAAQTVPNETIGHLIGRPFRDAGGTYTIVSASTRAEHADRSPGFVRAKIRDETRVSRTIHQNHPTAERVGWYHSHPCGKSQYSQVDRDNQQTACPMDYQLGILASVDGNAVTLRVLQGPKSCEMGSPRTISLTEAQWERPRNPQRDDHRRVPLWGPSDAENGAAGRKRRPMRRPMLTTGVACLIVAAAAFSLLHLPTWQAWFAQRGSQEQRFRLLEMTRRQDFAFFERRLQAIQDTHVRERSEDSHEMERRLEAVRADLMTVVSEFSVALEQRAKAINAAAAGELRRELDVLKADVRKTNVELQRHARVVNDLSSQSAREAAAEPSQAKLDTDANATSSAPQADSSRDGTVP